VRFVGRSEPDYPPLLRELPDPPAGLFLRGAAAGLVVLSGLARGLTARGIA
jgi:hypothetical protein